MHQLTEKKNAFSTSVLSVNAMAEISNLWVRFCFSAIGSLLYKKFLNFNRTPAFYLRGYGSKAPIAEKQKRTHKFEISTIALTDKTDVENAFFSQSADAFC